MGSLFLIGLEGSISTEKSGIFGDNALFVLGKSLKEAGFTIQGTAVARLPGGEPISLERRKQILEGHLAVDLTLIFGKDTERSLKTWFPVSEAIQFPLPYYFITEPGKIHLVLIEKVKNHFRESSGIFGIDDEKLIG